MLPCGPFNAATAAICEMVGAHRLAYMWISRMVCISLAGPAAQPTLKPGIPYVFEKLCKVRT